MRTMQQHARRFVQVGSIGVVLGLALTACAGGGSEAGGSGSGGTVTVLDYGGPYQEAHDVAYFKPCAAKLGIKIVQDQPTDYSKIKQGVDSGNVSWDVANVASDIATDKSGGKYFEPIDYSVVDKNLLIDGYAQKYRVGSDIESTVIAYNSDKYGSDAPKTWADLFDTQKFPGKRAFYKSVTAGVLEAALLADGVAPDDLYPLDVDRALKKLDTIKKDIVWWDTGAASQQLLASGEAPMGLLWVGRAADAATKDKAPIKVAYDSWLQTDDYWVIPKGAKNAAGAQKLIACMSEKDGQEKFSEQMVYGPTNKEAAADPEIKKNEYRPTNYMDAQIKVDDEYWVDNYDTIAQKFNDWLAQ